MKNQSEIEKLKSLRHGITEFNKSLSTFEWGASDDGAAGFLFVLEHRIKVLQRASTKKASITKGYIE